MSSLTSSSSTPSLCTFQSSSTLTLTSSKHHQQPKKRYEFSRGVFKDTITILDGTTPLFTLSDPTHPLSSTKSIISLTNTRTKQVLATFRSRRFLPDVLSFLTTTTTDSPGAGRVEHKKVRAGRFLRQHVRRDGSSSLRMRIPAGVGLGPYAQTLYWKISPCGLFMSLYSSWANWPPLAHVHFSRSSPVMKLIAVEVDDDLPETFLTYILMSASIIEHKFRTEYKWRAKHERYTSIDPVDCMSSLALLGIYDVIV